MVEIAVGEDDAAAKGVIDAEKNFIVIGRLCKEKENDKARKFYIFTDLKNP